MSMKISVSLPEDDVAFLDDYASDHQMGSRSAVVQRAVELLRASELGPAYADAWATWQAEDGPLWEATAADGLSQRR